MTFAVVVGWAGVAIAATALSENDKPASLPEVNGTPQHQTFKRTLPKYDAETSGLIVESSDRPLTVMEPVGNGNKFEYRSPDGFNGKVKQVGADFVLKNAQGKAVGSVTGYGVSDMVSEGRLVGSSEGRPDRFDGKVIIFGSNNKVIAVAEVDRKHKNETFVSKSQLSPKLEALTNIALMVQADEEFN
jgi:hypothetical protein